MEPTPPEGETRPLPGAKILQFRCWKRRAAAPRAVTRLSRDCRFASGSAPARAWVLEDDHRNALWDDLLHCSGQAWHWRDPESLANVEATVAALREATARDWEA